MFTHRHVNFMEIGVSYRTHWPLYLYEEGGILTHPYRRVLRSAAVMFLFSVFGYVVWKRVLDGTPREHSEQPTAGSSHGKEAWALERWDIPRYVDGQEWHHTGTGAFFNL